MSQVHDATKSTTRLNALVVLAICICAAGIILQSRLLVTATIIPLGYHLYGQLTWVPPLNIAVERSVSDEAPAPGEQVEVTVTVTNRGTHTIPKLHIIDGVPPELGVARSTPRRATALRPSESTTVTYTLIAQRGTHEFVETYLNSQSFSGTEEREQAISATGVSRLACHATVSEPLDRDVTHQYAGQVETEEGGPGLEFYATREHQHSDPVSRIDWNRYAKEKELTTITYRERRGAPVIILVDLRSDINVARREVDPPASELDLYAAHQLLKPLLTYGSKVGLAFFTGSRIEWLPPNRGTNHETRIEIAIREARDQTWSENTTTLRMDETHASEEQVSATARTDGSDPLRSIFMQLHSRLEATTNILVVSPLLDSFPERAAEYFHAFGHDVAILSPNVVSEMTPGGRVAALDRRVASTQLRRTGTPVISWHPDDPLGEAIAQTFRWRGNYE